MKRIILLTAAVGLAGAIGTPGAQAGGTTYRAPYSAGPQTANVGSGYIDVNTDTGEVTVFKVNPVPGAIGCSAQGAMGYLQVSHPINGTEDKVMLVYKNASLTQYSWLKVNVYATSDGATKAVGSFSQRGQKVAETGTIVVPLDTAGLEGATGALTIDFGIETGSACPNADGGTVTFPAVAVN